MKASDLFIKCLENEGVEYIFWVPGEENLDFLESMRKSGKIKLILTRNEQTAVFMAANYGRFTGRAGVAIATLGPGATNMVTGVAYAQLGGMPVIVITGQKPIKKSKQGQFQIIDVVAMMKPISKFAGVIVNGSRIPTMVRNAFSLAEAEKPGVVHLELPEDIAAEEVPDDLSYIIAAEKVRRPIAEEKSIQTLIARLENAKSPIILVGAGANRKRITKYLTKVIEKYNIPFFTSQMGKWVVDERSPQFLGTAALTEHDYVHKAIVQSDLILSVGYDVVEKPTSILGPNSVSMIHINFFPSIMDDVYAPNLEVVGDIWHTLWQLFEANIDTSNWDHSAIYKTNEINKIAIIKNNSLENDAKIMMPRTFVKALRKNLGESDIITLDNGLYKLWIARNYPSYHPNTVLLDNALATMWAGFSSAMTAKMLHPKEKVICITGDGGLVMNLGDIETGVRLGLDITIIILNNGSYGMIKWKQKNNNMGDFGLDFWNPDFVTMAESFGAHGYKVSNPLDFENTFRTARDTPGINIIDLDFAYPEKIV